MLDLVILALDHHHHHHRLECLDIVVSGNAASMVQCFLSHPFEQFPVAYPEKAWLTQHLTRRVHSMIEVTVKVIIIRFTVHRRLRQWKGRFGGHRTST